jgi:hypothetical protein
MYSVSFLVSFNTSAYRECPNGFGVPCDKTEVLKVTTKETRCTYYLVTLKMLLEFTSTECVTPRYLTVLLFDTLRQYESLSSFRALRLISQQAVLKILNLQPCGLIISPAG